MYKKFEMELAGRTLRVDADSLCIPVRAEILCTGRDDRCSERLSKISKGSFILYDGGKHFLTY